MKINSGKVRKIAVLTEEEVTKLGKMMHEQKEDELVQKRLWNEVYKKRGQVYKQVFNKEDI